jgi:hypothetical protein
MKNSQVNRFAEFLKEYKELIAAIGFFAGGILWVFGYFATKEEVRILNCLLTQHVKLLEGRQDQQTASNELADVRIELYRQSSSGQSSQLIAEYDVKKYVVLEQRRDGINAKIADVQKKIADADNAIREKACEHSTVQPKVP